ncbi:hypothetical protein D3C72_1904380 [compost metagenome]
MWSAWAATAPASTGLKITAGCSQRLKCRSKSSWLLRLMKTTSAALRATRCRFQSSQRRLRALKYCGYDLYCTSCTTTIESRWRPKGASSENGRK